MRIRLATLIVACTLLFGAALAAGWGLRAVGAFGSGGSQLEGELGPVAVEFIHNVPPVIEDDTPSLKVDLPFVNRTPRVVRVKEVHHCCGVAAASVDTKELQPGQETTLRLEIHVYGRHGKQSFSSSIHSDAGDVWAYRVHTTVYNRFEFDPRDGVRFGSVDPNSRASATGYLLIHARPGEAIPDTLQFHSSSEYTTVTSQESTETTLPDGILRRKVPLTVRLNAPAAGGVTNSVLIVGSRNKQGALEEAKMPVVWSVKRLYDLKPERLFFHKAELAGGPRELSLSIRRSDGNSFVIVDVKTGHPAVSAAVGHSKQAVEQRLLISVDPAQFSEALWDEVVVTTDHPLQPLLYVPVAAFAQAK
jgi:hypothetical protein